MPTLKHNYATLSAPGTKKVSVCARRIGSRDRMAVIAVCAEEGNAEKIVDALNRMQGALAKLDAPAQRALEEVRLAFTKERALTDELRKDKRLLETKLRDNERERDSDKRATETRIRNQEGEIIRLAHALAETKAAFEKA